MDIEAPLHDFPAPDIASRVARLADLATAVGPAVAHRAASDELAALPPGTPAALRARVHACLFRCAVALGHPDEAHAHAFHATQLLADGADPELAVEIASQFAYYDGREGDFEAGLERAHGALLVAARSGSSRAMAVAYLGLGMLLGMMRNFERAEEYLRRALRYIERCDDALMLARVCSNLGSVIADGPEGEHARAAVDPVRNQEAIALYERACAAAGNEAPAMRGWALANLAVALSAAHQRDQAIRRADEALELGRRCGDDNVVARALISLGTIRLEAGELEAAIRLLAEAMALTEKIGEHYHLIAIHELLSRAYDERGDYQTALYHYRRFHRLYSDGVSREAGRRAGEVAVKIETRRAHREREAALRQAEKLEAEREALTEEQARLRQSASVDALTGLLNRGALDGILAALDDGEARRYCIAMVDLDRFKSINDLHSHIVGDVVLKRIASVIAHEMRGGDACARYGGEEFALVLRGASLATGRAICERLRDAIERCAVADLLPDRDVTASIGVAGSDEAPSAERVLELADRRLYEAKDAGRNRVR